MPFFRKKKKEESGMKLRGFPGDLGTVKCLIMASEKKVKLETELLDTQTGAQDQADYRGLSPFGKYPYLQEGDAVSVGAEAALAYMDTRGNGFLNPKKAQFFGHQNYWWQVAESINDDVQALVDNVAFGAGGDSDMTKIEKALDALDDFLAGARNFMVSDYCFADVHWTAVAHFLELAGKKDLIDARANVSTWYNKVKQRPSASSLPSLDDIKQKQLKAA